MEKTQIKLLLKTYYLQAYVSEKEYTSLQMFLAATGEASYVIKMSQKKNLLRMFVPQRSCEEKKSNLYTFAVIGLLP
jgi:hypothetical protein